MKKFKIVYKMIISKKSSNLLILKNNAFINNNYKMTNFNNTLKNLTKKIT